MQTWAPPSAGRALFEILLLVAVLEWFLWTDSRRVIPQWGRVCNACLVVCVLGYLLVSGRPSRADFGLAPTSWTAGTLSLFAFTLLSALALLLIGIQLETVGAVLGFARWMQRNWYLQVGQQIVLQVLLVPRLQRLLSKKWMVVAVAASLFALLHAPNLPLIALTLISGVFWVEWFGRRRNLVAVSLSHIALGATALWCLNSPALAFMRVGVNYLLQR